LWFKDPDGYGLCFQHPVTKPTQDHSAADFGIEPETVA